MRVTFKSKFHNSETIKEIPVYRDPWESAAGVYTLTKTQQAAIKRRLCGSSDCGCWDFITAADSDGRKLYAVLDILPQDASPLE